MRALRLSTWAAILAAAAISAVGATWPRKARHLAVPVLSDPSLPREPGVDLAEAAGGCATHELARIGARVTAVLADGEGALWIGTFDSGLFRAGGEVSSVPGLRGRERFVNALAEHDGLVWAATQGGLLALDGDRRVATLLAGEGVTALAEAGSLLYAGTARGVFRISIADGAEREDVAGPSGETLRVTALAAGAARLWIGTTSGAYSLPLATAESPLVARTARWQPLVFGEPPAETNVVTALAPVAGGAVAGTDDGGVVRLGDDGAVSALRFVDARANEVNPGAAAAWPGGAAAIGTQGGGLLVVRARGPAVAAVRVGVIGRAEISALWASGERLLVATTSGQVSEVRCASVPQLSSRVAPRS
jgi:hypothetical protein